MRRLQGSVDLLALHRDNPERYPFLLQSTAVAPQLGRYDILFAYPGDALVLDGQGALSGPCSESQDQFLSALNDWYALEQSAGPASDLPFTGGWFLFLAYELALEVEPGLTMLCDESLPVALAVRCPAAIIQDRDSGDTWFVGEPSAVGHGDTVEQDIDHCLRAIRETGEPPDDVEIEEEDGALYIAAVERAKTYIADGDIYQANLSRQWSAAPRKMPLAADVYKTLCHTNPGPFAGIMHWDGVDVISSSPERLLHIRDGVASTRPIAGTRPRSDDADFDDALSKELIAHPKERAEHVMLIDLERNDLGRICESGSVQVDEMMVIESYAHVHHIVSNVRGRLRNGVLPGDAIKAVFPGGTITGCPKVRCMEIISELEQGPRGAYTGSMGYLNRNGDLDINILIRTLVMADDEITVRAGSGIVADSDPTFELAETRAKAKGMLRALSG